MGFGNLMVDRKEAQANESKLIRCTCEWTQDGSKIIPDKNCPVHGARTRKLLEQPVSVGGKDPNKKPMMDKIKFWAIAGTIAIFTAVIVWKIVTKFI